MQKLNFAVVILQLEINIIHNNDEYTYGEIVQKAEKRPLDKERIRRSTKKIW